jgi:hypothetical protein
MSIYEECEKQWRRQWCGFISKTFEKNREHIDNFHGYVSHMLSNPNSTVELVIKYQKYVSPEYNESIASNPAYSMDDIFNRMNGLFVYGCGFLHDGGLRGITLNPNFTPDIAKRHPYFKWNWRLITSRKNSTLDIMLKHERYFQYMNDDVCRAYRRNTNLTYEYLCEKERHNHNVKMLSRILKLKCLLKLIEIEPTITELQNPLYEHTSIILHRGGVDWTDISLNPHITMEFILQNKHRMRFCEKNARYNPEMFHMGWITRNSAITMKDIEEHPEIPWDYNEMFANPNLTFDMVEKHRDKMNLKYLLQNPLTVEKNTFIDKKMIFTMLLSICEQTRNNDITYLSPYEEVFCNHRILLSIIGKFL